MKKTIVLSTIFLGSLAFAQTRPAALGSDRDAHGCIGSAGYTYSQVKKDCVRLFEQKIKLTQAEPKGSSTSVAAVIFSKDMKEAEVFLSEVNEGSMILTRAGKGKAKAWKKDGYTLVPYKKNGYQLKKDNIVVYK